MSTELTIVYPKEYGLEESKANELTIGLATIRDEKKLLIEEFRTVSVLELTEENIPIFSELRKKIVKNRTQGIIPWHTQNKAYFLAVGRFVDAIKNKEIAENERMEEKLFEAEKHFENLEKERILKLNDERMKLVSVYEVDGTLLNLGAMPDEVFNSFLSGTKMKYEAKKEAERKAAEELENARIEKERKEKLHNERKEALLPYWNFVPMNKRNEDFSSFTDTEWNERFEYSKNLKLEEDKKQEQIRIENEKLKAENEAKEKAAKELRLKLKNEAVIFLNEMGFVKDALGMGHSHSEINHFIGANFYSDFESEKEFELFKSETSKSVQSAKEKLESDKILAEQKKANDKLQAELKAKADAEEAAKKKAEQEELERKKAEEKAAKAPRKQKLQAWVNLISMNIPEHLSDDELAKEIHAKFNGFKKWSNQQIEKL